MSIELITYVLIAIGVLVSLAVIIIQLIRSRSEVPKRLSHEEELLRDVVTAYVKYLRRKYSVGSEHEEFEE